MTVEARSLCPCESGLPFAACHGATSTAPEEGNDLVGPILDEVGTAAAVRRLAGDAYAAVRAPAARVGVGAYAGLADLLGEKMSADALVAHVRRLDRRHAFLKLAHLAAVLANSPGSIMGEQARAWTRDLLVERRDSKHPLEAAIGAALDALPKDHAVAHAHVVFLLQVLTIVHGGNSADVPHDAHLAFLMLAGNDHVLDWQPSEREISEIEYVLASIFLCTSFNRSDDLVRTVVRTVEIIGHWSPRAYVDPAQWEEVQHVAFGTSFAEYAELFLVPMLTLAPGWGQGERGPSTSVEQWRGSNERERLLYKRWISESSISFDDACTAFAARKMPSGLIGLPAAFFRHPFIRMGSHLVCPSPWHIRDYAILGTWAKLNEASKIVLKTTSSQVFSSAFGDSFETWCASVAREASIVGSFEDSLVLPSAPGAADEIEDVVLREGNLVALFSAKASLVPEANLKTAAQMSDVIDWLERFFFEDRAGARGRGYRGGAALLLDKKVQQLREGRFEARGFSRDVVVLPCIVTVDNVGESGVLYRWLEERCQRQGILCARPGVRPLTIITPEDYEALMALGAEGGSVCRLLQEKTEPSNAWGRLDWFLYEHAPATKMMRLPSMKSRFDDLVTRSVDRMKAAHDALDVLVKQGVVSFDADGRPVFRDTESSAQASPGVES